MIVSRSPWRSEAFLLEPPGFVQDFHSTKSIPRVLECEIHYRGQHAQSYFAISQKISTISKFLLARGTLVSEKWPTNSHSTLLSSLSWCLYAIVPIKRSVTFDIRVIAYAVSTCRSNNACPEKNDLSVDDDFVRYLNLFEILILQLQWLTDCN